MIRWAFSLMLALCGVFAVVPAGAADLRIGLSADVTTIDPHHMPSQPKIGRAHV